MQEFVKELSTAFQPWGGLRLVAEIGAVPTLLLLGFWLEKFFSKASAKNNVDRAHQRYSGQRHSGYESVASSLADGPGPSAAYLDLLAQRDTNITKALTRKYELLREVGGEFIPTGEYFSEQDGNAHDVIHRRQAQAGISYAARTAED